MNDEPLAKQFGHVIRRLRLARGMSQEKFAGMSGLHRTYIGLIERGERTVTIETARRLAETFGISLSELFAQVEQQAEDDNHGS